MIAGTVPATRRVPVALEQLNLKVPPAVLANWRAQAAAEKLSVRDWLMSITAPTAAPAGGAALGDRVAQLERSTAELAEAVAELRAQGSAPRSPRPASPPIPRTGGSPAPRSDEAPSLVRVMPAAIETAALADRLGMKRGSLNERIRRAGGACPGLVVEGWRCVGLRTPERGGPARALWVPAQG